MDLRYEPTRILAGVGFEDATRISRSAAGQGGAQTRRFRLIQSHPAPLGIRAVQVPSGLEVTLIRVDEGSDEIVWGPVRSEVLDLWHNQRGRNYKVPVELASGQRLDLRTRNETTETVEGDVRVRALRPNQLADLKGDIREDMSEVPDQAFGTSRFSVQAGQGRTEIVTIPTGEWCFDRAYLSISATSPGLVQPSVSLSLDDRDLFTEIPFVEREIYFPLQRLRREMKLSVESRGTGLDVSLLMPLYDSDMLLDKAHDTTQRAR